MFYFSDDFTEDEINDVVDFLNSMILNDWEKLRKDVEEELIIDDVYDDADTFIFIG